MIDLDSNRENIRTQPTSIDKMLTKKTINLEASFEDTFLQGERRRKCMDTTNFLPTPQKRIQQMEERIMKLSFLKEEINKYSEELQFALVGKFSFGYPEMKDIIKTFRGYMLKGAFIIEVLNNKHIFIQLENEADYIKIREKNTIRFAKYPIRILK